jgi:hypothetical protein
LEATWRVRGDQPARQNTVNGVNVDDAVASSSDELRWS